MRIKTFFKTLIPLKTFLLILMCTLFSSVLLAQAETASAPCGTDEAIVAFAEGNPGYLQAFEDTNQKITDAINQNPSMGGQLVQIPVVVHIMHNETQVGENENISDQQVFDAIDQLNDQFAGLEDNGHPIFNHNTLIRFTLAKIDPDGNCTNGIVRVETDNPFVDEANPEATDEILKDQSRWDAEKYLNVWVVEDANGANGYVNPLPVTLAGDPFISTPDTDGIVIRFDRLGGTGEGINTLAHEAGHYLFLMHPWANFNPNYSYCERVCHDLNASLALGDRVPDTNPCYSFIQTGPIDCNEDYAGQCQDECNNNQYPDLAHPKEIYMSYSSPCHTGLSEGQSVRMHASIAVARPDLVSPANLLNTGINLILPPQQDVTISQNATWDLPNVGADRGAICIDGTVTIESGATLTVAPGVIVMFGTDSEVIVEPGAQLIMDGSTFTACDTWRGIQVLGNSNLRQITANQGRVFMNSGATIEHAEVGIYTGERTGNSHIAGTTGGIVQAFNSTFRDNQVDVAFWDYANINPFWGLEQNNTSNFGLCHSLLTDEYRFSLDDFDKKLGAFIKMANVNGIAIRGHHFEDERSIINAERPSGKIGILSNLSGFSVDERCPGLSPLPIPPTCNGTRTRFVNLGYGIHSGGDNPSFSINVRNSDFECWHGIYLGGVVNGLNIHINNFLVLQRDDIPDTPLITDPFYTPTYGIYLDHCDVYSVEENFLQGQTTFGSPTSLNPDEHAGIIVRNNHGNFTQIYNNEFSTFSVATEAISQNRETDDSDDADGLEFRCNDFNNARIDMFILEDLSSNAPTVPIVGIKPTHDKSANLFSNSNSLFNILNLNTVEDLEYIHHNAPTGSRLIPTAAMFTGTVMVNEDPLATFNQSMCPNNILNHMRIGEGTTTLRNTKNSASVQYENIRSTLRDLVDNGNTPQMLNWVQTANNAGAAFDVYSNIMQQAPFTSNAVLEEVSKKEIGFSKSMIRNILRQHPQTAKSSQIQENLDNRINQLPQFMRNQINQGLNTIGAKEQMELDAASHKRERDQAISKAVQLLASDTLDRSTEMIDFLSNTEELGFEYRLAEIYDTRNETQLANNILNGISTSELSEKATSDHTDYMSFRTLMQDWEVTGKNLTVLEEDDIKLLHQYAVKPNITAIKAISLLELNDIFEYYEPVYFPEEEPQLRVITGVEEIIEENSLLVYPNPAQDYIIIDYQVGELTDNLSLTISDITGKIIYNRSLDTEQDEIILPTSDFPHGQYFCTLKSKEQTLLTEKIILIK